MATYLNKSSQYIQSLTDFILDTKPYHSKLTEVVEEYLFFDDMNVKIEERSSIRSKIDPVWLYNFFSSGDATFNTMPLKQLHAPLAQVYPANDTNLGSLKAFRDEIEDLANVPFVFSKKAFDGAGISDVLIERNGNRTVLEPLVEGLDYFQSHGSMQLQIRQTIDANTNFVPSWSETRDDNVVSTSSTYTRLNANDLSNPASAASKILALLTSLQVYLASVSAPTGTPAEIAAENTARAEAAIELSALIATVSSVTHDSSMQLPNDYELLLNLLSPVLTVRPGTPPQPPYLGWIGNDGDPWPSATYFDEALSKLMSSLYFSIYGDHSTRESGQVSYPSVENEYVRAAQIAPTVVTEAGDTWTLIAQSSTIPRYGVFSSINGYVGSVVATVGGTTFSSTRLTMTVYHIAQPPIGAELKIKHRNRLVFGPSALLERWEIIKVNPLAYSRPLLESTRYGYIEDQFGTNGTVTILDQTIPTSTVILVAQANGQYFNLSSSVEPLYIATNIQVNVPYNDGRLAFTIRTGTAVPFEEGDKFFIDIVNEPAQAIDIDLGYGYDLDSYDNPNLVYENQNTGDPLYNRPMDFWFASRFVDYDYNSLNLTVQQNAIDQRRWRMRAVPDIGTPIATLKKDGSGPTEEVDLEDALGGATPPVYSMPGDVDPASDIKLYFATTFLVEYSDDDFNTVTSAGVATVGTPFSVPSQGIDFTIVPGTKPFIAAISDDGLDPDVEGGDVFSFTVSNELPVLREVPLGVIGTNIARLVMHGDGFHEAPPALWTVAFTSADEYTIQGVLTEGIIGAIAPGPASATCTLSTPGSIAYEGNSFNRFGVHFTVVPGPYGLGAGDTFTFETFSRKPSFLVHGSVSGYQKEAVVGESYWNGHIGFTIEEPYAELFDFSLTEARAVPTAPNTWAVGAGEISITRIRFDVPSLIYTLTPISDASSVVGWLVRRSDVGIIGNLPRDGSLTDKYVTFDTPVDVPVGDVRPLTFEITADDFDMWNAQDAVILRPVVPARLPTANDFVLVQKRTIDRLGINLNYTAVETAPNIAPLAPQTIDIRFIDLFTGPNGLPIEGTSPETVIYSNWLPLTITGRDSGTSDAEFTDTGVQFIVRSAATGETIGTVRTAANEMFPTEFEWDLNFFATYLPLNAESNIVTYGSGFNEIVHARISESVKFLIGGGALTTDYMFTDAVSVQIDEYHDWNIFIEQQDSFATVIEDSPFGGFLAGYDNLLFDDEGVGLGYGAGVALTDHFLEAQQLAGIDALSPVQAAQTPAVRSARLVALLGLLNPYLDGDLASTTLPEFLANVEADPTASLLSTSGMGIPARGMGIDINIGFGGMQPSNPSTETTSAGVQDALVVMAIDTAYGFDSFGFGVGGLDTVGERTAIIYSGALPPVPNPLGTLTTYDAFETPLAVVGDDSLPTDFQGRVFEINFRVTTTNLAFIQAMPIPKVFIWLPSWAAPQQVAVVEKIGTGKYRVSVPSATEAKLYLQPGP